MFAAAVRAPPTALTEGIDESNRLSDERLVNFAEQVDDDEFKTALLALH